MLKIRVVKAMLRVTAAAAISLLVALSASAQTVRYVHTDGLGSVVLTTDKDRNIVERSEYEPYGSLLNRPMTDGPGYTGHVMDAATGLTYMQQRYYDPSLGLMLSVDPVTAYEKPITNFNRYVYALNNPYKFTDPDGRYSNCAGNSCAGVCHSIAECYGDALHIRMVSDARIILNVIFSDMRVIQNALGDNQRSESSEDSEAQPEPGTSESDEGCIYCVGGENTSSGKDYIGSTDDLGRRSQDKTDGRDRSKAEKIDSYAKGDRNDRRNKEQQAINDRGGKNALDNKRNEVAEKNGIIMGLNLRLKTRSIWHE